MSQARLVFVALIALALSGCSASPQPKPVQPDLPQLGLLGMWRVTAEGVDTDTWLRLGDGAVILAPDCDLEGGWLATETEFVADVLMWSGECEGLERQPAPWLTTATTYSSVGTGWQLLDADGAVTATLTDDGWPEGTSETAEEALSPPTVTTAFRARYAEPAPLRAGLRRADADALIGRWVPELATTVAPHLRFTDDRTVRTSDGCNVTTGRWLVTERGTLVTSGYSSTLIGCDGIDVVGALNRSATAAIDGDGSLHLISASGAELLAFVRDE